MTPIADPRVVYTTNGSLQVSGDNGTMGILVERDGLALGTILSPAQLEQLRLALFPSKKAFSFLLWRNWFRQAVDKLGAFQRYLSTNARRALCHQHQAPNARCNENQTRQDSASNAVG